MNLKSTKEFIPFGKNKIMIDNRHAQELSKYTNRQITRYDIINYLVKKNNFNNYLEIGVFFGETIRQINIEHKDGVDPGAEGIMIPEVNYPVTSDEFFNFIKGHDIKYDIVFIDGLHHSEQVDKDIENSLNHIVDNGFVILHDCNPLTYEMQVVPRKVIVWNGDVWKSIVKLKMSRDDLTIRTVDTDFGVGIIQKKPSQKIKIDKKYEEIDWEYFSQNRTQLLDLISIKDFFNLYL